MSVIYIYGLYDPRDNELRYIGKTSRLEQRLNEHLVEARKGKIKSYKNNWIKQLLNKNMLPYIEVLEVSSYENWKEKEKYWITFYKENGSKLTNIMNGGQGFEVGHKHSPEVIEKLKKTLAGRKPPALAIQRAAEKNRGKPHPTSEEAKRKLRAINLGKKHSQETIDRMRIAQAKENNHFYGKNHSEETRAKMRKPKQVPLFRENMSLVKSMFWAKRNGNIERIYQLQNQYFELFGKYNKKYPTP